MFNRNRKRNKRTLSILSEAGNYENPVTQKEQQLSMLVAKMFREDMEEKYSNVSSEEIDAAEDELYSALIDIGALHGAEASSQSSDYDELLSAIEGKLREGEYSSGFGVKGSGAFDEDVPGYGDLEDEYSPDYMGDTGTEDEKSMLRESFDRNALKDFFRRYNK